MASADAKDLQGTGHSPPQSGIVEQPAAPDPSLEIEPDLNLVPNDSSDTDSAFDETEISVLSASITSSIFNYKYENGRRYHAYREGEYPLPNDEAEQDRLDLHHHIFRLTLDGRLFRAPIDPHPQRVLDFGTGTGIWVMDFADEFPMAEVIGTDLSPIQPSWVPPNVRFYVDDAESDWVYGSGEEGFHFIHGRAMAGSIKDWTRLYSQIFEHLKPGGWLEMQEYETRITSDDDSEARSPYLRQWQESVNQASRVFGKDLNIAATHKQRLIDAGFLNVQDDIYKIPLGAWPLDPKLKELGRYQMEQVCAAIEPFALGYLTRFLGWSHDECTVLVARVKQELRDRRKHLYVNFHFVYGRKPSE